MVLYVAFFVCITQHKPIHRRFFFSLLHSTLAISVICEKKRTSQNLKIQVSEYRRLATSKFFMSQRSDPHKLGYTVLFTWRYSYCTISFLLPYAWPCCPPIHHVVEMCVEFRRHDACLGNHVESLGATHIGVLL